jgi:prefoldin subunit 5/ribosomal protein S13
MDENNTTLLDINQAEESNLVTIPGIGAATAKRLIAARPFTSLDDLLRVKGVSPEFLSRIRPYLKEINPVESVPPVEPVVETVNESVAVPVSKLSDEDFNPVTESVKEEAPEQAQETSIPEAVKAVFANQAENFENVKERTGLTNANLLTLLAACLATMVLSILLTIGLLGAINGSLRYSSNNDFVALSRQVESASAKLDMLEKDTDGIRTRLDALESLSGRMKLIEEENASIRKELDKNNQQVNDIRAQIGQVQTNVEQLQKSNNFFTRVIDGLRNLLNETTQP